MRDEQKIVIANTGSGVINVLITGPNPIVISEPNITEPGEVLPPGDKVDNSTIITPISLGSFIASFVRDFLAGSVIVLAVLVILRVLISF